MLYESFDGVLAPIIATCMWSLLVGLSSYALVFRTRLFDHLIISQLAPVFMSVPAIIFAFLMGSDGIFLLRCIPIICHTTNTIIGQPNIIRNPRKHELGEDELGARQE